MSSSTPRWSLNDVARRADAALRLVNEHRATIEPRLAAGTIDRLQNEYAFVTDGREVRIGKLTNQKVATSHERETAEDAHDLIMLVRDAVKRTADAPSALRTAIGVGDGLAARNTVAVLASLQAIHDNAIALAACGISSDDVAEADHLAELLRGADHDQSSRRAERATGTDAKNASQLALEQLIDQIAARGAIAFRRDPVVRARFEALVSVSGQGGADATSPAAPSTEAPPTKP